MRRIFGSVGVGSRGKSEPILGQKRIFRSLTRVRSTTSTTQILDERRHAGPRGLAQARLDLQSQ
eukprot:9778179-Prorocentrum_lima.AAC.1